MARNERKLWMFYALEGRGGPLISIFSATDDEVETLVGVEGYFGEALGKHSEVRLEMTREMFVVLNDTVPDHVNSFSRFSVPTRVNIGRTPFDAAICHLDHLVADADDSDGEFSKLEAQMDALKAMWRGP